MLCISGSEMDKMDMCSNPGLTTYYLCDVGFKILTPQFPLLLTQSSIHICNNTCNMCKHVTYVMTYVTYATYLTCNDICSDICNNICNMRIL